MALIYRGITIEDRKHEIILSKNNIIGQETEIFLWCYENFGNIDDGYWEWGGVGDAVYFKFLKETDAAAFKLRWS